jgi:Rieske 2Fe-2S family protein
MSPVDRDALAAVLRPLGEARMPPAAAYTDPAVLAWERRHLFAGAWTCLGRLDSLRRDGPSQRALTVGDVGVLLTFGTGGVHGGGVRAFANVCRHRGHELLPDGGSSTRPAVVCPYHGWAYRLDGALATAPGMPGSAGFSPGRFGLVELPATDWHGWVFVNALGTAPPWPGYLGGLAPLIAPYRPELLRTAAVHHYEVAANWKVIVENYQECYHCPLIHPELCRVSPPTSGENWTLPGAWVGGAMDLREHAETMSLDGRGAGTVIDGAPAHTVRYVAVFPNLLISAHPDYVMTHLLHPVAPDRTLVECAWLVPDGVADASHAVDFWDVTNRQDWAACESVQRGLASPHFRPGPLAPGEDAVHQWVRLVAACYLDPAGALAAACAEPAAPADPAAEVDPAAHIDTAPVDREEWAG